MNLRCIRKKENNKKYNKLCKFGEPKILETNWVDDPKENILKEIQKFDNNKG